MLRHWRNTTHAQVRDDIAANLRLKPTAHKWVMSFERPNLAFSVQRKQAQLGANFKALLAAGAWVGGQEAGW